jgi:hypothetical protein
MKTDESTGAYHDTFTKEFSNDLAYNLQNFRDMFVNKGVPVVIGEMGTSDFGNTQARVEWTTQYFETTKKYGIPCVLWDNGQKKDASDPTQNPGEVHGYIDRKTGEWFENNLPIINKMMEIMNDKSIVWGSEGKMPTYDHQDLSTGKVFLENAEIDVAREKEYGNSTPGKEISWNDLKGKEVAIKYTGDQPVLAVSDKDYKGWSEMAAYTVDEANGIAYYLVDQQVPKAYSGDLSTINHMQARTPGKTNIEKIVILDAPDVKIDVPVDKTRGGHAHWTCHEAVFPVTGSFEIELDDGLVSTTVTLDKPSLGITIPAGVWCELRHFAPGTICLVMASQEYDASGYALDRESWLKELNK